MQTRDISLGTSVIALAGAKGVAQFMSFLAQEQARLLTEAEAAGFTTVGEVIVASNYAGLTLSVQVVNKENRS